MANSMNTSPTRLTPEQSSSLAMLRAALEAPGDPTPRLILADALGDLDPSREERIGLLRQEKGWWSLREQERYSVSVSQATGQLVPSNKGTTYAWRVTWNVRGVLLEPDGKEPRLELAVASLQPEPWLPKCAGQPIESELLDLRRCLTMLQGSTPSYLVAAEETEWRWTCMLCLRDDQAAYQLFFPGGKIMRGRSTVGVSSPQGSNEALR